MAPSPDGNGVILVGGASFDCTTYCAPGMDSILELKSDGQGWVGAWTICTKTSHSDSCAYEERQL